MEKLMLNNKVIGIVKHNSIGYFHQALPDTPFSNFYIVDSPFKLWFYPNNGIVSSKEITNLGRPHLGSLLSVEQVFAFGKACEMHDQEMMEKIYKLQANNSVQYKILGRKVKNYNDRRWKERAMIWMKAGMKAKFEQDKFSKDALCLTQNFRLIETNPNDKEWGIGCDINGNFDQALGQNHQGQLLMEVRELIYSNK